jgi:hypothetical protein
MKKLNFIILCMLLTASLYAQNNCLDFQELTENVKTSVDMNLSGNSLTLEAWVKIRSFQSSSPYISSICGIEKNTGSNQALLRTITGNKVQFVVYANGGERKVESSALSTDTWYHVAGTFIYNGSNSYTMILYINGISVDAEIVAISGSMVANDKFYIGSNTNGRQFDGKIDEVRVWSDVRTDQEIRTNIYQELEGSEAGLIAYYKLNENSGTTADDSQISSLYDCTLTNMDNSDWVTSSAFFGPKNCLDFDGSDDYVDCGTINLSGSAITLECWVNVDQFEGSSPYISSLIGTEATGNAAILRLGDASLANNKVQFVLEIGRAQIKLDGNTGLDANKWYHIAGIYDGSEMQIFINGKLDASKNQSGSFTSNSTFTIANNSGRYFDGSIDEVRVWNDARTDTEIRENMCKNLTGNEIGLVAYYNFDNNSSSNTTLQDFSGNGNDGTILGATSHIDGVADLIEFDMLADWGQSWVDDEFVGKTLIIDGYGSFTILSNDEEELYFDDEVGYDENVSYTIENGTTEVGWGTSTAFNNWLNTSSSAWSTVSNWSLGSKPGLESVGIYSYTSGSIPAFDNADEAGGGNIVVSLSSGWSIGGNFSLSGNLILESDIDLNGQTITLGSSATLIEDEGKLTGSSGTITTTRSLSNIDTNVAGLGAEITEDGNLGSCTIVRGVQAQGGLGIDRYYQITTGNSPSNATFIFHYYDSELNGITESQLALFKSSDGSSWTEQTLATLDIDNNTLTLTGINGFSYWTAAEEGSGPTLPVVLSTFTAQFIENTPTIHWSTQSETDNMGWLIYRSDENDFSSSEIISDMIEGHGTTTQRQFYTYEDNLENPKIGDTYYYWLESIDYGGIINHYDNVAILTIPDNHGSTNNLIPKPERFGLLQNEPNPVINSTRIAFNLTETAQVDLNIYNLKGQLVKKLYSGTTSKHTIMWNGKDEQGKALENGLYLYRLLVNGKIEETKKLILLR